MMDSVAHSIKPAGILEFLNIEIAARASAVFTSLTLNCFYILH